MKGTLIIRRKILRIVRWGGTAVDNSDVVLVCGHLAKIKTNLLSKEAQIECGQCLHGMTGRRRSKTFKMNTADLKRAVAKRLSALRRVPLKEVVHDDT